MIRDTIQHKFEFCAISGGSEASTKIVPGTLTTTLFYSRTDKGSGGPAQVLRGCFCIRLYSLLGHIIKVLQLDNITYRNIRTREDIAEAKYRNGPPSDLCRIVGSCLTGFLNSIRPVEHKIVCTMLHQVSRYFTIAPASVLYGYNAFDAAPKSSSLAT